MEMNVSVIRLLVRSSKHLRMTLTFGVRSELDIASLTSAVNLEEVSKAEDDTVVDQPSPLSVHR